MIYPTILVATDMSDPAASAARHAAALVRAVGSRLVVVYVVEDRVPPPLAQSSHLDRVLQEHRRKADAALAMWCEEELEGLDVERVVCEGTPHVCILDTARAKQADLIVVGMRGHNYLTHVLVGSTAERVLHGAPCPVLVVGHDHRD